MVSHLKTNPILTQKSLIQEAREKKKQIIELISLDFEDIRISNEAFIKLKLTEFGVSYLSGIQIGTSIVQNELQMFYKDKYDYERNILLRINLIVTILNIILVVIRYQMHLSWAISKGLFTRIDTLLTTGQIKKILLEIFIVILGPYEFFRSVQYEEYQSQNKVYTVDTFNELLTVLCLGKCFFFLRASMYFSRFTNPRSQRVCSMSGCKANTIFAIKSVVKDMPYTFMFLIFVISALASAYAMMVFERPLNDVSGQDFNSYWNSLWLIVVTMTTVGYGDLYPKSNGGRIIGAIMCIWGIFITSYFTVTLTAFLTFTPQQGKAYMLLQRLYYKDHLQKKAVQAVTTLYRHKLLAKDIYDESKQIDPQVLSSAREFRTQMVEFKDSTRKMLSFNEGNSEMQYMVKEVEKIGIKVKEMSEDIQKEKEANAQINKKLDMILQALTSQGLIGGGGKQASNKSQNSEVK